jgi:hypothetical protein
MNDQNYNIRLIQEQALAKKNNTLKNTVFVVDPLESMKCIIKDFKNGINRYEKDVRKNIYIYSFCDSLLYKLSIIKSECQKKRSRKS